MIHTPVLLPEVIKAMQVIPGGKYVDATAGEGGHAAALAQLGADVIALDWDAVQISNLQSQPQFNQIKFMNANYSDIQQVLSKEGFKPVDGILFDFGLSMKQIAASNRGFSFKELADPLDMRIDLSLNQTAAHILNQYTQADLEELFAKYSEDLHAPNMALAIYKLRKKNRFKTVRDLVQAIRFMMEECNLKHSHRFESIAARVFQALRIVVNHEFENIVQGLEGAVQVLKPTGKILVITFHSLEDRIVKQFALSHQLSMKIIKNKGSERRMLKAFERSATLRVLRFQHE